MNVISNQLIHDFFEKASKTLSGEWILIGGCVLIALDSQFRSTLDIDIVSKKETSTAERIELMDIAEKLGLPVEAINTAAEYFLKKIPNYEDQLEILYEKKNLRIHRPTLGLFIKLKAPRLSESDLEDCLHLIDYYKKNKMKISEKNLNEILNFLEKNIRQQDKRAEALGSIKKRLEESKFA